MAAPKDNRYGLGNANAGRPAKYKSVEEFKEVAEEYLDTTRQKNGMYKPTIGGLAFHLGFESPQSLHDYGKDEAFSYTVKRLMFFVHTCYEQQLYGFAWAGSAFALKNVASVDWKDEVTQNITQTNVTADFGQTIQPTSKAEDNTQLDK
jgi:hypothetical protein